ncbi:MAG: DNA gyrase/topoisomerase IV subunit B [Christensenellales bacterium]|jgi:DNA gyrase subunit B
MAKHYDADDIKVLEGLDAVRMRPGMYIGSTGSRGLHHMLWEIVDNAMDEVANGYGDTVKVTLHADNSVTVEDNGRGVPVGINKQMGVTGVELVYTQLHAGGKFDNEQYAYSGGLHGVGASVVNALSSYMEVEVFQGGKSYFIRFTSQYDPKQGKVAAGKVDSPLKEMGKTWKKGTRVHFLPDATIFDGIEMSRELVTRRLRELAFLNKGAHIVFTDERKGLPEGAERTSEFHYEGGLSDFVRYLNQDRNVLFDKPIYFEGSRDDLLVKVAIQFTDGYTENLFSYVNNIPTTEGGTHETGFKTALTKVMNDYARSIGALKEKDANLSGEDYREGMTAVIALAMRNVQFEGQTKTRLGNNEARIAVEAIVGEQLQNYLADLKHQQVGEAMIAKAVQAAKVRDAARKAKDLTRKKNSLEGAPLVGKLSACTGRTPEMNELFIVEGDSAGGSAKQARDRRFQAILPLRGKPLNAEKKQLKQVLENEEFRSIITALGTGIDHDFDLAPLKYHKVIILSDADQDGAHIRAILLTFFFRYMRELLAQGHVYIGRPPLYKVSKGGKVLYAYDDAQLAACSKKLGRGYAVQRYKGLGEMNPEQLWETTMNPANRSLIQVNLEDAAEADRIVTILMGDKVEPRRNYINEYANFNKVDSFQGRAD